MNPLRLKLDAYPLTLPHIYARPEKPGDFLLACDGTRTFDALVSLDPQFESLARHLDDVVWLDRSTTSDTRAAEPKRVLVLSAHPEDAYVSMGGWLIKHRAAKAATVVSCFSRVVATTRPESFVSPKEISAIRRDEADVCAVITGATNQFLDLPAEEVRRVETPPGQLDAAEVALRRQLKLTLWQIITQQQPAQLFVPAAIGGGRDQRLLLDAVMELFEDAWFPAMTFHLYEDFPFCASYLAVDDFLATFENAYVDVQTWYEDITPTIESKLVLLAVFKSRLVRSHDALARSVARRNLILHRGSGDQIIGVERFWTLGLATELSPVT